MTRIAPRVKRSGPIRRFLLSEDSAQIRIQNQTQLEECYQVRGSNFRNRLNKVPLPGFRGGRRRRMTVLTSHCQRRTRLGSRLSTETGTSAVTNPVDRGGHPNQLPALPSVGVGNI